MGGGHDNFDSHQRVPGQIFQGGDPLGIHPWNDDVKPLEDAGVGVCASHRIQINNSTMPDYWRAGKSFVFMQIGVQKEIPQVSRVK